jgi:hypothetical protein
MQIERKYFYGYSALIIIVLTGSLFVKSLAVSDEFAFFSIVGSYGLLGGVIAYRLIRHFSPSLTRGDACIFAVSVAGLTCLVATILFFVTSGIQC